MILFNLKIKIEKKKKANKPWSNRTKEIKLIKLSYYLYTLNKDSYKI